MLDDKGAPSFTRAAPHHIAVLGTREITVHISRLGCVYIDFLTHNSANKH